MKYFKADNEYLSGMNFFWRILLGAFLYSFGGGITSYWILGAKAPDNTTQLFVIFSTLVFIVSLVFIAATFYKRCKSFRFQHWICVLIALLSPFIIEYGFIATQQEISEGFGLSYETASLINGALSLGILLLVIIDGKKDSF